MCENTLVGLNSLNSAAYVAFTSENLRLSFRNPVPGVVKTAPDFTFVLKNAAGKSFRLLNGLAPAPSHEISRRPAGCSPAVPPFDGSPNRARYSTTFAVMSPVADMTVGTGGGVTVETPPPVDRKRTRLNSSHSQISYAVFCLKKKTDSTPTPPPPERRSARLF